MVLESTIVCVDNSEYMRNSDFLPTRIQAQQDAVSIVCHSKTRSNPESNVGLLTMSSHPEVLSTLTTDVGRILSKLHQVQPNGDLDFLTSIRIAHLALKHRQGKNHKMRIVVFVGSPIELDEAQLVKLAKRLKKEKVNVDIVNFGQDQENTEKLTAFINTLNGREGTGSHLVTVPPGPHLSDALISSPVVQGEDGTGGAGLGSAGFEFGIDPNEDPELALALRVSMEEQRQRQEESARRAAAEGGTEGAEPKPSGTEGGETAANSEEALLERALAMSLQSEGTAATAQPSPSAATDVNFGTMSEEEQIAYAMQMSLAQVEEEKPTDSPVPMDTDDVREAKEKK
ncbi:26S proteasome non-ATPase regulatory subunit 4 [Halotydeus destructor]|nr:26S proteasome non-ATPase regulatory subunit 4 [Halotydeus destructor]